VEQDPSASPITHPKLVRGLDAGLRSTPRARGITVNAVAPGLVDTEIGKPLIEAGFVARIPVGRIGASDEIAQAVMLLVRDAYITGQTLAVNGSGLFS
jgi:3-oxoacyl-[acyl-carrier protein] reductase